MGLVRNITKVVNIPGEDDTVIIRKLNHKTLKKAARARQTEGVSVMKEIGAELIKALRDEDDEKLKRIQDKQESDISSYDMDTLLKEGIVSWTYDGVLPNDTDELAENTAKFIAKEILDFSRGETKEEAKNV